MSKTVTLVLVDKDGALGVLPAFDVDVPYWPEVAQAVATARSRFGVGIAVLRLLTTETGLQYGGAVTYLAEADHIPDEYAASVDLDLSAHPKRAPYACSGGPAASLRWAAQALAAQGLGPVTDTVQHRTWNLSAIWQLSTPAGPVWLKEVPRFFWHEADVLRLLASSPTLVPRVLAAREGRMLLEHVPGEDLYQASDEVCAAIAADYHRLQVSTVDRIGELREAGIPDGSAAALVDVLPSVVTRYRTDAGLDALVAGLKQRLDRVSACGLPDTLVHGDLHPGNVRSDGRRRVIIDWGDSSIGHPGFDIIHLTEGLDPVLAKALIDAWADRWRADVPGCDPHGAVELLRPVAALRNAYAYATFLDNIEPAEHPYHAADVPFWLGRASALSCPVGEPQRI